MSREHFAEIGEEFALQHVYDPQKAREYYLRTRELKGRRTGRRDLPSSRTRSGSATRPRVPGAAVMPKDAASRKAAVELRVKKLEGRLEKLKAVLAELVKQAKKRSGVDTAEKDSEKKAPSEKSPDAGGKKEKATAAEKKAAKARYEKEKRKEPSLDKKADALAAEVKRVEEQIKDAREDLRAALKRARSKLGLAVVKPPTGRSF